MGEVCQMKSSNYPVHEFTQKTKRGESLAVLKSHLIRDLTGRDHVGLSFKLGNGPD